MNPVRIFLRAARILRTNNASHTHVAAVAAHYHSHKYTVTGALTQQKQQQHGICIRHYSNQTETDSACLIDSVTYDRVCSETLDGLSDYFDELIENATDLPGTDVAYGVRTYIHSIQCQSIVTSCFVAGRRINGQFGPSPRHLCDQSTVAQQANLA